MRPGPVLLLGQSRGGALSVAYAGLHPAKFRGVVNFVGGWVGDRCRNAIAINRALMNRGAAFPARCSGSTARTIRITRWTITGVISRPSGPAGGRGRFIGTAVPGGNGHSVILFPKLWAAEVDRYLGGTKPR